MVPIRQNLVSSSKYSIKCPYSMTAEGITVHNTANKASAANEVSYMIGNNNEVSYHYAVDDIEIIQGVPENRNAWHAGDGGSGTGNRKTIGIEICYSTGDKAKFEKAQENAAEFVAYKLKEKGWGTDRVYPHKHWSGKHCPHRTLDEYGWDYFIGRVQYYLNGSTTKTTTSNVDVTYQTWDDVKNTWLPNVVNDSDYAGIFGHDVCAIYANLAEGDCVYKVHTQGGSWLSEVKNRTDYAGIFNKPIDGFMIKSTNPNITIYYQVHTRGGKWLGVISQYNANDSIYGYAGIFGQPIDAIRMYAKKTVTTTVTPAPAPAPAPVVVKEYEVLCELNTYTNASNASQKVSANGTLKPGIYYIYTKYPNGYGGMFNITDDKSGSTAGAWINPSENVKKEAPAPKPVEPKEEEKEVIPEPEVIPTPEPEVIPIPEPEPEVVPTPEPEPEPIPVPENNSWVQIVINIIKKIVAFIINKKGE